VGDLKEKLAEALEAALQERAHAKAKRSAAKEEAAAALKEALRVEKETRAAHEEDRALKAADKARAELEEIKEGHSNALAELRGEVRALVFINFCGRRRCSGDGGGGKVAFVRLLPTHFELLCAKHSKHPCFLRI
jgi:hypothetical protein